MAQLLINMHLAACAQKAMALIPRFGSSECLGVPVIRLGERFIMGALCPGQEICPARCKFKSVSGKRGAVVKLYGRDFKLLAT